MRKGKIYISGPITGWQDYYERFRLAKEYLRREGYCNILNPAEITFELPELEYEDYMRIDLALLGAADQIYLMPGWEESRGARAECQYAIRKGMDILIGLEEHLKQTKEQKG